MANKVHVKKGDTVYVLSGKDRGKKGKVLSVNPSAGKVLVEGVNIVTKHQKPRNAYQQGGIIQQEAPINSAKVMLVCDRCSRPTKIAKEILNDGSKVRKCKHCGETIDVILNAKDNR